jgi:hypothetical protein
MNPRMLSAILLGLAVGVTAAAEFPQAELSNGQLRVKVYLPDAKNGFYRSTRFDWSGAIGSLKYKGHEYYAPWFQKIDPVVYDLGYEGNDVTSAPFTAMVGPAEEFQTSGRALGWDEAKPGGTFIKIGVGVLRKPNDNANYDHSKPYEIVDSGKWTVKKTRNSVEFVQEVADASSGYGYRYTKILRLVKGKAQMTLEHTLANTGTRAIESTVYNHNFLVLDNQPPGPDFAITFPFQLQARRAPTKDLGELRGNQIVYLKTLEGKERMSTAVAGFSDSPKDYDIRVENRKLGVGVRTTADRPLSSVALWSIKTVLAVEPFIAMKIEPKGQFAWKLTYDYYTLPAGAK